MTRQANPYLLTVLSGPNAGATAGFAAGRLRIGGAADDQIVLAGVAPGALRLHADGDRLHVSAAAPGIRHHDISTGEVPALPVKGTPLATGFPATLQLGDDTLISIARLGPAPTRRPALHAGLGLAMVALAAGLWIGAQFGGPATQARAALPEPSAENTRGHTGGPASPGIADTVTAAGQLAQTAPRPECGSECMDRVADAFASRLEAAGLAGIQITAEDGVLRATGAIAPGQTDIWQQERAGFEAEFGQSLPLITRITQGDPAPVLAIASVWLGKTPEIRTKAGAVLRVGDTTGDGWQVSAITRGEIRLDRDGRQIKVRF